MSSIIPNKQSVFINSTQARIFDFNTISSKVYLGEAINSLLRSFGNNVVLNGFKIKNLKLNNNLIELTLTSGEAIIDHTLIQYPNDVNLELNVNAIDDRNGYLVPNLSFNFIQTQQKNLSKLRLTYITKDGKVPDKSWFTDVNCLIFGIIEFNKDTGYIAKQIIPYFNRPKITIENKEYIVYPTDYVSNRMLSYLYEYFRI